MLVTLFILILLCLLWGFLGEVRCLRLRRLEVELPNLPPTWQDKQILHLSDLHWGPAVPATRLADFIEQGLACQPDLVVLTGDLCQANSPFQDEAAWRPLHAALTACARCPLGAYAVFGNHDKDPKRPMAEAFFRKSLQAAGWDILENRCVERAGLKICGLDDVFYGQPQADLTCDADLILVHEPDYALTLPPGHPALILSGHSHNGQVTFLGQPLIRERMGSRYTHGLYALPQGRQIEVSAGMGTVHIHARFCNPPEIPLLRLHRRLTPSASSENPPYAE